MGSTKHLSSMEVLSGAVAKPEAVVWEQLHGSTWLPTSDPASC